jgi:predicted  nucleic acid-binding Zn-ribbon protein
MTKLLFILSALLIIVSSFFAFQNGREFTNVRNSVTALNGQVQTALAAANKVASEVGVVNGEIAKVQDSLNTEVELTKAQKLKLAQVDNDTKRAQDDLDSNNKKLADLRVKMEKLPKDMKPETMLESINTMKKTTAELQAQVEMKKKEVEAEEAKMVDARKALDEVVRKIEDRKKSFDRNSLAARVVAVNNDWGFVVVDAGQKLGITEATKLLVTRGTQTVGKLSIVSVQGDRTVANIVQDSLSAGMTVAPGDRVILENLYQ